MKIFIYLFMFVIVSCTTKIDKSKNVYIKEAIKTSIEKSKRIDEYSKYAKFYSALDTPCILISDNNKKYIESIYKSKGKIVSVIDSTTVLKKGLLHCNILSVTHNNDSVKIQITCYNGNIEDFYYQIKGDSCILKDYQLMNIKYKENPFWLEVTKKGNSIVENNGGSLAPPPPLQN